MFLDAVHGPLRQTAGDPNPRVAVVRTHVDVRRVVVTPVSIEGGVHPALHRRRLDAAHVGALRESGKASREVRPGGTAVGGTLDVAVVGADEEHVRRTSGLADRGDRPVVANPVVARQGLLGDLRAHDQQRVAVDLLREVGALASSQL